MSQTSEPTPRSAPAGAPRLWSSALGDDVAFLLARANALSLAVGNGALAPFGLKVRSYSVIALTVGDARPSQRELSEFLRLDPSQIVALIDDLQARGLVVREPDPADRRANVVAATEEGRALHAKAVVALRAAENEHLSGLDAAQRADLTRLLRILAVPD